MKVDPIIPEKSQEQIVLTLVQGSAGEQWAKDKIGWSSGSAESVCIWYGIRCNAENDAIVTIDLRDTNFYGELPTELGLLNKLQQLILLQNDIRGTIPSQIMSLPELTAINLSNNNLVGSLPEVSSIMKNLLIFDLGHNHLTGTISEAFSYSFPSIRKLDLSHNSLTGEIPTQLGFCNQLGYLNLSSNRLSGTIPDELGKIKEMKGLFLDENRLIGTIPSSLTSSDNKLIQLFLEKNYLSGTVPISLADLPKLVDLYIDENKFTGTLPKEICYQHFNEEFFADTKFDGEDRDGCTSVACPADTMSREGVYPCYPCTGVNENSKGLAMNPYLGRAGRCYPTVERTILDNLYDKCGGEHWSRNGGWGGFENVPKCEYEGITCNGSGHVVKIILSNFGLVGTIPEEIGFLRHLEVLDLSDNSLVGLLPSSLRFPPLELLDISGNKLVGYVPPLLCLKPGINDNKVGNLGSFDHQCDKVVCGRGTYSPYGREVTLKGGSKAMCEPCYGDTTNLFLGSKTCIDGTIGQKTKAGFYNTFRLRSSASDTGYDISDHTYHGARPELALISFCSLILFVGLSIVIRTLRRKNTMNTTYVNEYRPSRVENALLFVAVVKDYVANKFFSYYDEDGDGISVSTSAAVQDQNHGNIFESISLASVGAHIVKLREKEVLDKSVDGSRCSAASSARSGVSRFTYRGDGADDDTFSGVGLTGVPLQNDSGMDQLSPQQAAMRSDGSVATHSSNRSNRSIPSSIIESTPVRNNASNSNNNVQDTESMGNNAETDLWLDVPQVQ